MTANGWLQIGLFFAAVLLVAKPMGLYLYRVYERKSTWMDRVFRPIEKLIYRVCGVDETKEMRWMEYGVAMLLFSGVSLLLLYLIQRVQLWLPWNPQKLANVAPDLAWNTAVSFTTNTNWQSYTPETTMSYLTQMAGLAYHNFVSSAWESQSLSPWFAAWREKNPRPLAISGWTQRAGCFGCCCRYAWLARWCWCRRERCKT